MFKHQTRFDEMHAMAGTECHTMAMLFTPFRLRLPAPVEDDAITT